MFSVGQDVDLHFEQKRRGPPWRFVISAARRDFSDDTPVPMLVEK
jgi:hypothetical protein